MTIDNDGTKDNQGLLRFQGDLVYIRRISTHISHVQSCKLFTSCGRRPWAVSELFANKIILLLHQDRQKASN